ncbi:hypothetical protein [Enterococcus sp. HY326]|uniref:hypothetical protein n=1 Tax=Enterococcus sp. HY326 TaxID=2971265 RepID=UPI0022405BF8|nr:hypothetical protein [Enterococcus sp. HY326]
MHYPITEFDSLGARQLPPKEDEAYEFNIDKQNNLYHKATHDDFNVLIEEMSGVFELTFSKLFDKDFTVTVTDYDLMDAIDNYGASDLTHIVFIGYGKEFIQSRLKEYGL